MLVLITLAFNDFILFSMFSFLQDENDNAPVFEKDTISITIKEGILPGSTIAKFQATDADSGVNKNIEYLILSGNEVERFMIDSQSGTVTVRSQIERDPPSNEDSFQLTVRIHS